MKTAGVILDVYDDPKGSVLINALRASGSQLPEKVASMELSEAKLDTLPDRLFGLVATNNGQLLRKYAMHDEGHLSTSIIYFMHEGTQHLPGSAQQKVAANLVNACAWYDMDPPEALVKVAMQKVAVGNTVELSPAESSLLEAGAPTPGHVAKVLAKRENMRENAKAMAEQTAQKTSDLNGTNLMPNGALHTKPVRSSPMKNVALPTKAAALLGSRWSGAGDLSRENAPVHKKVAQVSNWALPGRGKYPLDTVEHIKTAEAYFEEEMPAFSLDDRREFAHNTHLRAQSEGVKLSGRILEYAGSEYGPYVDSELLSREKKAAGTGHESLFSVLRQKLAEVSPEVMVGLLKDADSVVGFDQSYGRVGVGVRDPYQAVYGGGLKLAEEAELTKKDTYSWLNGTEYVSGPELTQLSGRSNKLDEMLGKGFSATFAKDPIGIFESLPEPQKVLVSRMAKDTAGVSSGNS